MRVSGMAIGMLLTPLSISANILQMVTERYIRKNSQWVKITRDAAKRTFTIARGWASSVVAHDIATWSFKWVPTWRDAESLAHQSIADHT